jgi:RPA family protein
MEQVTDPVGWVFADELRRAKRGENGFITPTGGTFHRVFLIGVLTEVHVQTSRAVDARLSDPTGGFSISVNRSRPHVADLLTATEPPAFVALSGELSQRGREEIRVIVDSCQVVEREERDRFVYLCAEEAIQRLEAIGELSEEQREIAEMVAKALNVVDAEPKRHQNDQADKPDLTGQMISLIEDCSGPKGALLADVLQKAGEGGVGESEAKAALTILLEEGDCYMPTNSTIRLL